VSWEERSPGDVVSLVELEMGGGRFLTVGERVGHREISGRLNSEQYRRLLLELERSLLPFEGERWEGLERPVQLSLDHVEGEPELDLTILARCEEHGDDLAFRGIGADGQRLRVIAQPATAKESARFSAWARVRAELTAPALVPISGFAMTRFEALGEGSHAILWGPDIRGVTLARYLRGGLDLRVVKKWLLSLADAVQTLHEAGIAHGSLAVSAIEVRADLPHINPCVRPHLSKAAAVGTDIEGLGQIGAALLTGQVDAWRSFAASPGGEGTLRHIVTRLLGRCPEPFLSISQARAAIAESES
ncbi:MAG: hypothetical protein KC561_06335, partial [Myxococcales bacterium]|nr:hypothetical protein [Myxococcales bacterium]